MRHTSIMRTGAAALCIAFGATGSLTDVVADEKPTSVAQPCLNHPSIKRTKVLDDRNILFVTKDHTTYHNLLPRQCPTVRRNAILNYHIVNRELCSGSISPYWQQVGGSYVPTFVCQLGVFVPVSEDEVVDLIAMTENESRDRRTPRRGAREMVQTERVDLPGAETPAAPAEPSAPAP